MLWLLKAARLRNTYEKGSSAEFVGEKMSKSPEL